MTTPRRTRGFTTVELMVALAIFALIAAIAAPSFRVFVANQRLRSASFELVSDLVSARSEALKRNTPVAVVPDDDGWASGWTVEVVESGEQIRTRGAVGSGLELDTDAPEIVFDRSGRVEEAGVVSFDLAAAEITGVTPRCVTLDPTGRARSERRSCT
jgi:type IV fimbrial biogenesis protein FimT